MSEHLLSRQFEEDAAMLFLSSSSIGRYETVTRSLARRAGLDLGLRHGSLSIEYLLQESESAWRQALQADRRGMSEIRAAIYLMSLAEVAETSVDSLLRRVALHETPSTAWLAALARNILKKRASNETVELDIPRELSARPARSDAGDMPPASVVRQNTIAIDG